MHVVLKLICHPLIALRYLKKYVDIRLRRMNYRRQWRSGEDLHQLRRNKALTEASARSEEALFQKWQAESGGAFIPAACSSVFGLLAQDRDFCERVIRQADRVLDNSFYILYQQIDDRMSEDGHYRWFEDYRTGYRYKLTFYMDARTANRNEGVDIKRVWEMARMQYLLAPALAFRLTGDVRYADKVRDILCDFSEQNPKYHGPNWNPSMEIGIRAANIVLAIELIRDSPCADAPFVREMVGLLADHAEAILENEENTGGKTSNHYLGGLLGLAAISTHLPFLRRSGKNANYAADAIAREIHTQILDDGGDYEGSTSYHRLVGELLGFALLASRNGGHAFSKETMERLYGMTEFTRNLTSVHHMAVQVGDNDSGRVFQILPEDANDHRYMVNLLSVLCGRTLLDETGKELLGVLFGRPLPAAEARQSTRQWLAPQFGIGRMSDDTFDLFVSCVNAQKYGMGGHTHNDLGSFTLNCKGYGIIVDPGSGNYTGDPAMRNRLRSIDSHSAIKINGKEPRSSHGSGLFAWEAFSGTAELEKTEDGFSVLIVQDGAVLHRCFAVESGVVSVRDTLEGDIHSASMTLVFAPGTDVKLTAENSAEITGPFGKLILKSNWTMTQTKREYAPHYDKTVLTAALCLSGTGKDHTLTIRCGGSDETRQGESI